MVEELKSVRCFHYCKSGNHKWNHGTIKGEMPHCDRKDYYIDCNMHHIIGRDRLI